MTFSIEIDQGAGFNDISKYCLIEPEKTAKVPYVNRNRDYTPIFDIWDTILDDASGIDPAEGDIIKITVDGSVVFNGYISKITPSERNEYKHLEIAHYFQKLEKKVWEYNSIHADLASTSDPFEYHENIYNPVNSIYLLKKICSKVDITLITSYVENTVLFQYNFPEGGGNYTPAFLDVKCKDTYYDFKRLLGINQPEAAIYTTYDDQYKDYNKNKISFLELFKKICSQFEFDVIVTGYKEYTLYRNLGNYQINQNEVYEGEADPEFNKASDLLAHWRRDNNITADFYGYYGIVDLDYYTFGKGGIEIDYDPTMRVYFYGYIDGVQSSENAPPEGDILQNQQYQIPLIMMADSLTGITFSGVNYNENDYVITDYKGCSFRKWASKVYNYNKHEVIIPYQLTPKSVMKNFIDLWEETSEIEQDTLVGRRTE